MCLEKIGKVSARAMPLMVMSRRCLPGAGRGVSGCTLQACKPCACPASRLKKEHRVNDRDISGLVDGGILRVCSKVLELHPTVCGR